MKAGGEEAGKEDEGRRGRWRGSKAKVNAKLSLRRRHPGREGTYRCGAQTWLEELCCSATATLFIELWNKVGC